MVAARSGETVPKNSTVDESARWENAAQMLQGLIRTLRDALQRRQNTIIRSSDPIFAWTAEWSAGLITRYVRGETGRIAYSEVRRHDAQAPVAEFGED